MRLNLMNWMKTPMLVAFVFCAAAATAAEGIYDSNTPPIPRTPIDKMVFAKLAQLNIHPVLCSDAVFVRRVYLDLLGILPTAQEAREFIQNSDTYNKRRILIDQLLQRPEYADYWAMRWSDILRIKAEFPVNLWPNAAQAYHRWIKESLTANKPYDQFVREMLTSSGSNFRVGPVNFYRAAQSRTAEGLTAVVALTFMGSRIDKWPANQVAGMAAFFSQVGYKPTSEWKEEDVFWDPIGASTVRINIAPGRAAIVSTNAPPPSILPTNAPPQVATFPDGKQVKLPPNKDPRDVFADWLITPDNPWFSRTIVNRIWYWLLGRGIIHEPDDIRPDNPPVNPALLAYLEKEFVNSRYNMKHIYRLVLNSQAYQLSSIPHTKHPEAAANFASYPLRRLDAEVLIDAINSITGTTDLYTSPIPEPFTYIPENMPAVGIADGSISSPFLTMFGRTARATGMESERDNSPQPSQWRHLLNSSHIQRKIEQGTKLRTVFESGRKPQEILEQLYLTFLSRMPTPEELKTAEVYGNFAVVSQAATAKPDPKGKGKSKGVFVARQAASQKQREAWVDIAWSLVNSTEFLYRH